MILRRCLCSGGLALGIVALVAARDGARARSLPTPRLYVFDCDIREKPG